MGATVGIIKDRSLVITIKAGFQFIYLFIYLFESEGLQTHYYSNQKVCVFQCLTADILCLESLLSIHTVHIAYIFPVHSIINLSHS